MQPYSEFLLQFFHHTSHQGRLDISLSNVYTTTVGTPGNQDLLQLFLQISNGVIVQASFLAAGSVAMIAGSEWLCDYMAQKKVSEIKQLTLEAILKTLTLPDTKVHIANLLYQAVNNCMDDYLNA